MDESTGEGFPTTSAMPFGGIMRPRDVRSGVLPARRSPLTKEAIGILVEDGLMRAHVIGGPDFGEIEEALRRLEVTGAVRLVGAGFVVEWGG